MPNFIFKIVPPKHLTPLESHDAYKDARTRAREMRAALPQDSTDQIKIIHAKSETEAEKLLLIEREPPPLGEELG